MNANVRDDGHQSLVPASRAGRREWAGLAVLALPTLLASMDLTVLHLALPHLSADLQPRPDGSDMLLENKTAVVCGGGGAIGGAAACAFAREGARVHLAGRTPAKLGAVAPEIQADGGAAEVTRLDDFDEGAVREHADAVVQEVGVVWRR